MFLNVDRFLTRLVCWVWATLGFETQDKKFERAEGHLLSSTKRFYQEKFIAVGNNQYIRTVIFNPGVPNKPPLLLLHGLDSGLCSFLPNVKRLSRNCTVYAIDLPGFGRSSKPDISGSGDEIERKYVEWLELWRQRLGIEKFFLLGHDFGGYIATVYTLFHPWRVCQLILYDPWGFPILPFGISDRSPNKNDTAYENPDTFPNWILKLNYIFHFLRRSLVYRFLRFYCQQVRTFTRMVRHPFQFLQGLYQKKNPRDEYEGLCKKVQAKSGKAVYCQLSVLNVWAKDPLIKRINSLDCRIFVTFIFGSKSWFDHRSAYEVKCSRTNQESVSIHIVESEGKHAIHLERPRQFESIILNKLKSYEEEQDEGWMEDDWIRYDNDENTAGYEQSDRQQHLHE